jgi:hypothetical protein
LLPARLIADIKTASRLKLAAHELMKPVGLPAAAATGVGRAQVVAAVGKLPARVSKTLGVEEWR